MYQDLKKRLWWSQMKRQITQYVAKCDVCQRVKAEHLKPAGTLQPLPIPEWKWEEVSMDFITRLPRTQTGFDSIWVIVDRLTKVAHFIPVKTTYSGDKLAELYLSSIICLHGVPKVIVSDRDPQFTSHFWKCLHKAMGTDLSYSSAYHPQIDGQTERVNQVLENVLQACVLSYSKNWEKCLPFAEFSYNNSFQSSIQMSPFEALYGRSCRTPLNWSEAEERLFYGPTLVEDAEEQVHVIRGRLQIAQSRQKSYADHRRRELSFEVDDHVYLKVSPMKGMHRFQVKGKLAPRYIGPFRIIVKLGPVAYQLELPPSLSDVHDVFHVSQLKKYLRLPTEATELEEHDLQPDLSYQEHSIHILEQAERKTRNRNIKFIKVQWSNHTEDEATWEHEDLMRKEYPDLFPSA